MVASDFVPNETIFTRDAGRELPSRFNCSNQKLSRGQGCLSPARPITPRWMLFARGSSSTVARWMMFGCMYIHAKSELACGVGAIEMGQLPGFWIPSCNGMVLHWGLLISSQSLEHLKPEDRGLRRWSPRNVRRVQRMLSHTQRGLA